MESDLPSKKWVTEKENMKSSFSPLSFFEGIAIEGRWFPEKTQATDVSEQKLKA